MDFDEIFERVRHGQRNSRLDVGCGLDHGPTKVRGYPGIFKRILHLQW